MARSPVSPSSVASRKLLAVFLPPPGGRLTEERHARVRSPVSPSSVAGAPPSPPGGRLRSVVQHFQAIPLSHTYKSALYLTTRDCRSSLPPGGEGVAPATDEGEIGEWNHRNICFPCLPPGGGRKTASSLARQRRMRAKQANAIFEAKAIAL